MMMRTSWDPVVEVLLAVGSVVGCETRERSDLTTSDRSAVATSDRSGLPVGPLGLVAPLGLVVGLFGLLGP